MNMTFAGDSPDTPETTIIDEKETPPAITPAASTTPPAPNADKTGKKSTAKPPAVAAKVDKPSSEDVNAGTADDSKVDKPVSEDADASKARYSTPEGFTPLAYEERVLTKAETEAASKPCNWQITPALLGNGISAYNPSIDLYFEGTHEEFNKKFLR